MVDGPSYSNNKGTAAAPVDAKMLVGVPIGANYIIAGCGPDFATGDFQTAINNASHDANSIGFRFPETGEFVFSKSNQRCTMNAFNYGYESGAGVTGFRPQLTRVSYKANLDDCCWNNPGTVDNWIAYGLTCDPKYRDQSSSECRPTMLRLCASDTNGISNMSLSKCQTFYNNNNGPSELTDNVKKYCSTGNNLKDDAFCKNLKTTWKDDLVKTYCAANPNDKDFCGCYNLQDYADIISALNAKGQTLIPWCHIKTCAANPTAYKPSTADASKCPSQQICLQGVDVSKVGGSANFSNVNLSCNQVSEANGSGANGSGANGSGANGSGANGSGANANPILSPTPIANQQSATDNSNGNSNGNTNTNGEQNNNNVVLLYVGIIIIIICIIFLVAMK